MPDLTREQLQREVELLADCKAKRRVALSSGMHTNIPAQIAAENAYNDLITRMFENYETLLGMAIRLAERQERTATEVRRIERRAATLTDARGMQARHVVLEETWAISADGLDGILCCSLEGDDEPEEETLAFVADNLRRHGWPLTEMGHAIADKERPVAKMKETTDAK